jgi:hypothetical protein
MWPVVLQRHSLGIDNARRRPVVRCQEVIETVLTSLISVKPHSVVLLGPSWDAAWLQRSNEWELKFGIGVT